jgi:hypothetical protein
MFEFSRFLPALSQRAQHALGESTSIAKGNAQAVGVQP